MGFDPKVINLVSHDLASQLYMKQAGAELCQTQLLLKLTIGLD